MKQKLKEKKIKLLKKFNNSENKIFNKVSILSFVLIFTYFYLPNTFNFSFVMKSTL